MLGRRTTSWFRESSKGAGTITRNAHASRNRLILGAVLLAAAFFWDFKYAEDPTVSIFRKSHRAAPSTEAPLPYPDPVCALE